jgi:hemerythrin superfamily protein
MVSDYLDIQINRLKSLRTIKLYQTIYLKNLIKRYDFEKLNPRRIFLQNQLNIELYNSSFLNEKAKNRYQSYIGNFIYIMMNSRLNLIFSIFFINRFIAKSNEFYDKLIKEIFRYIKGLLSKNIIYRKRYQNKNLIFITSTDSDWTGSSILENGKSTSEYIFFLSRNSIS